MQIQGAAHRLGICRPAGHDHRHRHRGRCATASTSRTQLATATSTRRTRSSSSPAPPRPSRSAMRVSVSGIVSEFGNDLPLTEISVTAGGDHRRQQRQCASRRGADRHRWAGCRRPKAIDNDGLTSFNPATDGIDFWESLEGMRVTIDKPLVVSPSDHDIRRDLCRRLARRRRDRGQQPRRDHHQRWRLQSRDDPARRSSWLPSPATTPITASATASAPSSA